ncbi:MAG: hypothetical protein WA303_25075, partial [Bradyrhizobium sp.]
MKMAATSRHNAEPRMNEAGRIGIFAATKFQSSGGSPLSRAVAQLGWRLRSAMPQGRPRMTIKAKLL